MTFPPNADLKGNVALVAGGTRGAGRGIAVELGAAGATVYITGRTTRTDRSPMGRPETIDETAQRVNDEGGVGIPVRVDHARSDEVRALLDRIDTDHGRLDILVNDVWGGDPLTEWDTPFWHHDLANGLALVHNALDTHIITSWHAAPLLIRTAGSLIVEVTDGVSSRYRGSLFYDLAKAAVTRLALAQGEELRDQGVAVIALTPGFLRSEAILDQFGVTEQTWQAAIHKDPHFAFSETPHYIGRAVAALAADPNKLDRTGTTTATWQLANDYGITDLDGSRPNWGQHALELGWAA